MSEYNEQRAAFDKAVKTFDGNNSFAAACALLLSGEKTVSFNRKIIDKNIDSSWLTEIEKALPHLDTVIRNPRNTIKEVEEIVPIAMSRKITVESIKSGKHPYRQAEQPGKQRSAFPTKAGRRGILRK